MKKSFKNILRFAKKYPNRWHSFSRDKKTLLEVKAAENIQGFTVNHITNQFYFNEELYNDVFEYKTL